MNSWKGRYFSSSIIRDPGDGILETLRRRGLVANITQYGSSMKKVSLVATNPS